MALVAGDLLQGRYRVGPPLGQGGMGSVFEAREEPGGQELTVKQLRLDAPSLLDAFRTEFALLARVSEPHLLRVVDFGSERLRGELHHYYVAERIAGVSLAERARQRRGADHLRAVTDALLGLSALHEQGVSHGDFTPANILVDAAGHGVLIDLSCARPFGPVQELSGTDGYVAPELLAGRAADARSDLYGVGRTLEAVCTGPGRSPSPALTRLIERLLRESPSGRPIDCVEVLEALGVKAPRARPRADAARFLGREAELLRFEPWLSGFAAGDGGPRVLSVHGAAGVGLSRLVRELAFRAELRVSVLRGGPLHPLGWLVATALGLDAAVTSRRALLAAAALLTERSEPLLLVIEDLERLDSEERELVLALVRTLGPRGNFGLLVSSAQPLDGESVSSMACEPLDESALREWLGARFTGKRQRELIAESAGSPKRLMRLLTESGDVKGAARSEAAPRAAVSSLVDAERGALAQAFVAAEPLALGDARFEPRALEALLVKRLLEREGELLILGDGVGPAIEAGALSAVELREAHRIAATLLDDPTDAVGVARAIRHWALAGEVGRAEQALGASLPTLRAGPRKIASLVAPLLTASRRSETLLALGALWLDLGQARQALRAAAHASRRDARIFRRAALLAGDALARLGRPGRAERLLARLLDRVDDSISAEERAEILLRLARVRLQRGDYPGALRTASTGLEQSAAPELAGLLNEVVGVASAYTGETAAAEEALHRALSLLGGQARPRDRSRIQSHRAMVAFRLGRVEAALGDYAAAVALAEEHDQDDLIATGLLNLGTAEQQVGLWGEALAHYERGVTFATAIGRMSTELTLEYNRANLFSELGAFERAEETLLRLERKAARAKLLHFGPSIALVRAEMALARRDADAAEGLLLEAERAFSRSAQPRELFEVRLRRVDVELLRGRPQEAERKLKALAREPLAGAEDLALSLEQARARVEAALGRRGALALFEVARGRAHREGLLALEATLEGDLSSAAKASGQLDEARQHAERARRLWDRIGSGLPQALTAAFWQHPRRAHLLEQSRPFRAEPSGQEAEAYRRLLALNRRLNSSLSLERVLEYAVQAALDLTEAERGFLLLTSDDAASPEARVVVARSTEPSLPEGEGPSQSIVRRTLEREEPILTTDAQGDPRFAGQGSVHALRLKSVLSVPVLSPSGTLGVLYVDCRVQRGRFSESERSLLAAFADQLALAIGNARLHQRLEQKTAELLQQKHAVEQLSRGQAREIERLKREVKSQRETLELRYDYSQIIGRGPAMRAVLERLDRVIESEASVLVRGESGTGKELVARAIHWNGPRKAGPFLGINCAALPEALLEAELFGHVRGAFTGADRDKQGLMQAAAGGTLFLDELGELSLATQAKLLRAIQEREVRPLGSEKSVPLDVRLVAATHRDLERAMAEGKFREDLYYRVAVVSVVLPPLRDRPEDLPALAQKILERLAREAGKKPPELGQAALRRLSAHPFPGNVRELENVLTRAFVLAPGSKIAAEDLDLGARRVAAPRARSRRDFEDDERDRILSALRASRWNVSVVGKELGIPRNTLYRKLARYGLSRPEGS